MSSRYLYSYVYVFFISLLCLSMLISQSSSQIIASSKTSTNDENTDSNKIDDISNLPRSMYCKFQPNRYQCGRTRTPLRYYWDIHGQSCKRFDYGNCHISYNMYNSIPSCRSDCEEFAHTHTFTNVTANIFCWFQPEFGGCNSYHPRWYFDIGEMKCKGFSFSGCGGNHNRFDSPNDCMLVCGDIVSQRNRDGSDK